MEGTPGLMPNHATLYEEVELLGGGASRGTVIRNLIDMLTPDES